MNKILKAEELPSEEKVYLKKGFKGWQVVHPIRNEDKSINWKNLLTGGSWWNVIITLIIVLIIVGVLYEYSTTVNMFLDCFRVAGQLEVCKEAFGEGIYSITQDIPLLG